VFKEDILRENADLSPNIGEVLVSLCYNSNISRLTVTVFEAKGIKVSKLVGLYFNCYGRTLICCWLSPAK